MGLKTCSVNPDIQFFKCTLDEGWRPMAGESVLASVCSWWAQPLPHRTLALFHPPPFLSHKMKNSWQQARLLYLMRVNKLPLINMSDVKCSLNANFGMKMWALLVPGRSVPVRWEHLSLSWPSLAVTSCKTFHFYITYTTIHICLIWIVSCTLCTVCLLSWWCPTGQCVSRHRFCVQSCCNDLWWTLSSTDWSLYLSLLLSQ